MGVALLEADLDLCVSAGASAAQWRAAELFSRVGVTVFLGGPQARLAALTVALQA